MTHFPSLPDNPQLSDVLKRFPKGVGHLLRYHDAILRGPSELTVAQRELIAAYVSSLNACGYCAGAHQVIAEAHGIAPGLIEALIENVDTSDVEERLKPILHYVAKLTRNPASVRPSDAESVQAAGWSDDALFDAISICALFNFMNRIVEGSGVVTSPEARAGTAARHKKGSSNTPYEDFGRSLGIKFQ